jgi:hypothetical protein
MTHEEDFETEWAKVKAYFHELTGKRPDLNGMLFLIGVRELGQGVKNFSKEQKQDLMHIAICKVLSFSGYYELEGLDEDGWPHWKPVKKLPSVTLKDQEHLLKLHIIEYLQNEL